LKRHTPSEPHEIVLAPDLSGGGEGDVEDDHDGAGSGGPPPPGSLVGSRRIPSYETRVGHTPNVINGCTNAKWEFETITRMLTHKGAIPNKHFSRFTQNGATSWSVGIP
jgi:hypothetical protein